MPSSFYGGFDATTAIGTVVLMAVLLVAMVRWALVLVRHDFGRAEINGAVLKQSWGRFAGVCVVVLVMLGFALRGLFS